MSFPRLSLLPIFRNWYKPNTSFNSVILDLSSLFFQSTYSPSYSNCCWQELHLQALSILGGIGHLEPPARGNQQQVAQHQWPLLTSVIMAPFQQQGEGAWAPLTTDLCCAATDKREAQQAHLSSRYPWVPTAPDLSHLLPKAKPHQCAGCVM